MDYQETLAKTEAEWDAIVAEWERKRQAEKRKPIIKAERKQRFIWENLFAYGVALGIMVQIALWYKWIRF